MNTHSALTRFAIVMFLSLATKGLWADIILDNGQTGTSSTGTWQVSGAAGSYGTDSLWARNGATYTWTLPAAEPGGSYEIFMWWSPWSSRGTNIAVDIISGSAATRIYINQSINGSQWNSLGTYDLVPGAAVKITAANGSTVSTCADAVMFKSAGVSNAAPTAYIDSVSPNPATVGNNITFIGHGTDSDGNVVAHEWSSNVDGFIGDTNSFSVSDLSAGSHTISYRVKDDAGAWSSVAAISLTVNQQAAEVIVDNGSVFTSSTGTWQVSGATGSYGTESVWARNGATYTWLLPSSQSSGSYEVFMWWSPWSSRGTNIAVDITSGSTAARIYINQSINGSQWNSLGTYDLVPGAAVKITAANGSTVSTCADAVMFKSAGGSNAAPTAYIDSISPNPATAGNNITFIGHGTDSDGTIAAHEWSSNVDGIIGDTNSFSLSDLSAGSHTISYRVKDDAGTWSSVAAKSLTVNQQAVEVIVDDGSAATASTGTWQQSSGTSPYGATSLWARNGATYTWYMNAPQSGTYEVFMWWSAATSRTSSAAVAITSNSGTKTVYVNQTANSGRWNSLGKFTLLSTKTYAVKITAASGSTVTTCADAVKYVKVADDDGSEKIYVGEIYSWDRQFLIQMTNMLKRIGATAVDANSTKWTYTNSSLNKKYTIRYVQTKDGLLAALNESGSHVIVGGHSNFGLAAACVTSAEMGSKKVASVLYADDPRFALFCSDNVAIKTEGMIYGQAYPNWTPVFQDGSSAMAPYTADEGTPPYNYYISYKPSGATKYYRVQLEVSRNYITRFTDTRGSVWFSSSGAKPDPQLNPEYFIVYPYDQWSCCRYVGKWIMKSPTSTYQGEGDNFGYNYATRPAGTGSYKALFDAMVFYPGRYQVKASWITQSTNATNTRYLINHAAGSTTVTVNQTTGNTEWNTLGTFNFNRGINTIEVSDNANGDVIADAVILTPASTPEALLNAEFTADKLSGSAPLAVTFTSYCSSYNSTKKYLWDFGDGSTSTSASPSHTYSSAGAYTVSLKLTDARGNTDTETKAGLITVGSSSTSVRAEFASKTRRQTGSGRLSTSFINLSTSNAASWLWDFGDGTTSTLKNPKKVYYAPGLYTVTLTATGSTGSDTSTEQDYIQVTPLSIYIDNAFSYKPHYLSNSSSRPANKNILNMSGRRIDSSQFKYARLFYGTCSSAQYFLDTFQHGIVFVTTTEVEDYHGVQYLENYMKGLSDAELVELLNNMTPAYDYVNFNLLPPSAR